MTQFFKNLPLSKKLLITPVVMGLFLIGLVLLGFQGLRFQQSALDEIFNWHYQSMQNTAAASQMSSEAQGNLYKLISWGRANYPADKIDGLGKEQLAVMDSVIPRLKKAADLSESADLRAIYVDAGTAAVAYRKALGNVIDLASFDLNTATMAMGTAEDKFTALSALLSKARMEEGRAGQSGFDGAAARYHMIVTVFVIGIGAAAALSLLVVGWINRMIMSPIRTFTEEFSRIGSGDLSRNVEVKQRDELGEMAIALNVMLSNLRDLLGKITTVTRSIAESTLEISSSTEQMAAGAEEQNTQANEVATTVEEMTRTITENSRSAATAAETAGQARQAAEKGGAIVSATTEGMRRIAEASRRSAETVQTLGQSSRQIGEIIEVIDDIADQTNLLALNAAIEAARAGEQGRGFAVVADEVRKLAERTTKATKEIATMINAIRKEADGAVGSMAQSSKEVEEGISLAEQAAASLQEIVGISHEVTAMVSRIASASSSQAASGEQIAKNVSGISSVTEETAKETEQVARSAGNLHAEADTLQKLLGKFRLSDGERSARDLRRREPVHELEEIRQ
jgi:methyl-accepting chemotaxis protein